MTNKVIKIFLVSTSLAPILLTYWFVKQVEVYVDSRSFFSNIQENYQVGILFLVIALGLVVICLTILKTSKRKLEELPIKINEIKSADKESLGFIIVYLLPLAKEITNSFSLPVLIFVAALFFFVVFTSNSYHFNPLLNFFGYHFYEVKIDGGITYIMLSRRDITTGKNIKKVYQISEYMIIEK